MHGSSMLDMHCVFTCASESIPTVQNMWYACLVDQCMQRMLSIHLKNVFSQLDGVAETLHMAPIAALDRQTDKFTLSLNITGRSALVLAG